MEYTILIMILNSKWFNKIKRKAATYDDIMANEGLTNKKSFRMLLCPYSNFNIITAL